MLSVHRPPGSVRLRCSPRHHHRLTAVATVPAPITGQTLVPPGSSGYTGPEPTVIGYNPTPVQPTGTPAGKPQSQQVAGSIPVVVQQTVAAPPAASTAPSGGIPVVPAVFALAGIGVIGGGGLLVRRWWIRRQNPALFRKYD